MADQVLRFTLGQPFELCIELEDPTDFFKNKQGGWRPNPKFGPASQCYILC